ncbi:MAG: hypothetical protein KDD51_01475 [Bdellovibrionales bacterium]|nr:hypothetical protein [Bdellovibrionales bacterium]
MLKKITLFSLICFTSASFASSPSFQHEVEMNLTESALSVGGTAVFAIGAGYQYGLTDMFQVGGRVTFTTVGSTFVILAGGTLNLNIMNPGQKINYADALFIQAYLGFTSAAGATSFTFEGTVGKRFAVLKNVAYNPELGLLVAGGAAFIARPLQFSVLF